MSRSNFSAFDSQFDAIDPIGSTERVARRLRAVLPPVARAERAFVNVDMESYAVKDLTLSIFQQVMAEPEFRRLGRCRHRHSSVPAETRPLIWAACIGPATRGTPVWVRLVKGAYWDYETIHAQARGWPIPVFQQKWERDANSNG